MIEQRALSQQRSANLNTMSEVIGSFAEAIEQHLRRIRDTGEVVTIPEIAGETPAYLGRQRWWMAHYFPLRDAGNEVTYIGAAALEIKRAEGHRPQVTRSRPAQGCLSRNTCARAARSTRSHP